jgi:hypothetical protein
MPRSAAGALDQKRSLTMNHRKQIRRLTEAVIDLAGWQGVVVDQGCRLVKLDQELMELAQKISQGIDRGVRLSRDIDQILSGFEMGELLREALQAAVDTYRSGAGS